MRSVRIKVKGSQIRLDGLCFTEYIIYHICIQPGVFSEDTNRRAAYTCNLRDMCLTMRAKSN